MKSAQTHTQTHRHTHSSPLNTQLFYLLSRHLSPFFLSFFFPLCGFVFILFVSCCVCVCVRVNYNTFYKFTLTSAKMNYCSLCFSSDTSPFHFILFSVFHPSLFSSSLLLFHTIPPFSFFLAPHLTWTSSPFSSSSSSSHPLFFFSFSFPPPSSHSSFPLSS